MHRDSPFNPGSSRAKARGFTLVEIMIVVVIIGVLAAMALPAMQRLQRAAQNRRFISDLRVFSQVFETYALARGAWPDDGQPGVVPPEVTGDIRPGAWEATPTIGGQWDWDYLQASVTADICIRLPTASAAQMQEIDAMIDDGNLSTGNFRTRTAGSYMWVLAP